MQFDHIGIFVESLGKGREHLSQMLEIEGWTEETHDDLLKVSVQFGEDASGQRYELVAPRGEGNPVSGSLERRANLLNHVAYRVEDLDVAMALWREAKAIPLGAPKPAKAFDGARVAFFMSPLGFIVELIDGFSEERTLRGRGASSVAVEG